MHRTAILFLCLLYTFVAHSGEPNTPQKNVDILRDTFGFSASSPSDYPWSQVHQGCSYRDCIPSIDHPEFIGAKQATFLFDEDIVIAIANKKHARAYPIRILVWHELVNDVFDGIPIVVSYCPLCGSALVFERSIAGSSLEFGVSGLLYNSDLIMYDRSSNSLWQQITGHSFAGAQRGQSLTTYPSAMTSWKEWREAHPDTQVLSTKTEHSGMQYKRAPYGDYANSELLMFPVALRDARRHPKLEVVGIEINGQAIAYGLQYLRKIRLLQDEINGNSIQIRYTADGMVTVTEEKSGRVLTAHQMFWFAWYSFHPNTLLRDD
jgi:hypothetical protein